MTSTITVTTASGTQPITAFRPRLARLLLFHNRIRLFDSRVSVDSDVVMAPRWSMRALKVVGEPRLG